MKKIRAGFVMFIGADSEQMVGVAVFNGGICTSVIYNRPLLEKKMEERFGDLYIAPEYLSHSLAGMKEDFWSNFLARATSFVKFTEIKDYTSEDFNAECKPMIPYMNLLEEKTDWTQIRIIK